MAESIRALGRGVLVGALLGLPICTAAQESLDARIGRTEVATWKDACLGALSLTHDDDRSDFVNVVGPALDARGLKGTFNIIVGRLYDYPVFLSGILQLAAEGHELASHTMQHHQCEIVAPADDPHDQYFHSAAELAQDCMDTKRILDDLQPRPTVSMAYPGGSYTPETAAIVGQYFLAARTTGQGVNPPTPLNMMVLIAARVGYAGNGPKSEWLHYDTAYASLRRYLDQAINDGVWVIEMYHSLTSGLGQLDLTAYYDHLDDLVTESAAHRVWVAPQGDVARYILSRNAAVITLQTAVDGVLEMTVDDGLPESVFDVPLTLRTVLPHGVRASVTHDGQPVASRLDPGPDTDTDYCIYSVPADGRLVSITWKPAATPAISLSNSATAGASETPPAVPACSPGLAGLLPLLVGMTALRARTRGRPRFPS